MGDISQELVDGINIIVDEAFKSDNSAKLRIGLISNINTDDTYDVIVDTKNLPNMKYIGNNLLTINQTVYLILQNNNPNMGIILG